MDQEATPSPPAADSGEQSPRFRSLMRSIWVVLLAMFVAAGLYAWSNDFISLQGERTIYTADCRQGNWQGNRCTGRLVAGDRYKFRALRAHGEVLFWTAGSSQPSGKFTGCSVESGRNWTCPGSGADASQTVTLTMERGSPVADPQQRTRALHSVSKLRWLALREGLALGATANE